MTVSKDALHRLVDRLDNPLDLDTVYTVVKSLVEHDDQAWYWTERWQRGEQEAEADKKAGRISPSFTAASDFMRSLGENSPDTER